MTTLYITPKFDTADTLDVIFNYLSKVIPGVDVSEGLVVTGMPADLASSLSRSLTENGHTIHLVEDQPKPEPKAEVKAKPQILANPAPAAQPAPKAKRPYTRKPKPEPQEEERKEEAPAEAPFVWVKSEDVQTTVQITEADPLAA